MIRFSAQEVWIRCLDHNEIQISFQYSISFPNGALHVNSSLAAGMRLGRLQTPKEGSSLEPAAFRMSLATELAVLLTVPGGIVPLLHQFGGDAFKETALDDLSS
jgi:hypothetical protein